MSWINHVIGRKEGNPLTFAPGEYVTDSHVRNLVPNACNLLISSSYIYEVTTL